MIADFPMRASPWRTIAAQTCAAVCGLTLATGVSAQYRYLILDAPVDAPQAMDPETLELQGEGIVYDVVPDGETQAQPHAHQHTAPWTSVDTTPDAWTRGDGQHATWTLDAPSPEPTPGPGPSSDPYAPKFEHTLPWPVVLDERPAGPQSVQPPPVAAAGVDYAAQSETQLPPPPLPPAPAGPRVLDIPEAFDETNDTVAPDNSWMLSGPTDYGVVEPAPMPTQDPQWVTPQGAPSSVTQDEQWVLPESSALAYAEPAVAPAVPAPAPAPYDGLSVVVDRQLRGTAPLRLTADGKPMLSVQTLEALRLPVPTQALDRGFATPDDLAQSYGHAFDAAGQMLVLTSLAPPAMGELAGPEAWAPAPGPSARPKAPPQSAPLASVEDSQNRADCAPRIRRGRNTRDCP